MSGLQPSRRNECRQFTQAIGSRTERRERAVGGVAQFRGELTGAVDSAERHKRCLPRIGPNRLARVRGLARHVEQIVDNLEREAEVLRLRRERGNWLRRRPG
jgi:hypothetical protein